MKASLEVLSFADTRKAAILGDMGELGSNKEQMHYEVGRYAASQKIDLLCCIGELSYHMYKGACETEGWTGTALYFPTKAEFLSRMQEVICPGDTVLVKASHFMDFPEIVEKL